MLQLNMGAGEGGEQRCGGGWMGGGGGGGPRCGSYYSSELGNKT